MTPQTFQINGRIIDRSTKKGVANLQIEAWDKDLIFNDLVGSTTTDAEVHFQIEFSQTHYQECFGDRHPDLFFKVFRQGRLLTSTENSILWNHATPDTEITIEVELKHTHSVSDEVFRQVYDSPASLPGAYQWLTPDEDVRKVEELLGMPLKTIGAPLWVSGDSKRCTNCDRETNWLNIVSSALDKVHSREMIARVILGEQKFVNYRGTTSDRRLEV
ncbi:hypothetical protein [Nostoc parmelioides]|uniref:Uncharacterized protein n=1 Tax=Nostoc parmelioides FACHB-3921 TaxID=2692909 RepID=A0ABR8BKB0_9NOSO|nr:hypothetical protein [Nostoc parmelioides]MBD2254376.1 hypothetical protein [Nostoc parmelioides FACHB-3921]